MKAVTGADFCRALARNGWQRLRTRGSHQTWGRSDGRTVSIPVHAGRTLGRGLLAALLKRAELSETDL